ncbi:MAG: pyridoxal phosphate-dependent aminotransferase, partial [Rhodobacteraceae bacterium]|nr:pyridoxal phosphate-dependent aminotransferase [Paracoccaceae bacterium]
MALLSSLLGRVAPSPTVAMTARAREMKAEGRDVIGLAAGEPDFDTPAHIREAAHAAIEAGHTRYTAVEGIPELRQAIADHFATRFGIDAAPGRVCVSTGGKQAIFNAILASVEPGDEVIVPAPYWVSYPDIVRLAGGTPVIVPTTAAQGFRLTPETLAAAITPATKWLILNSPGNPTGAGLDAGALMALAEVLRAHPHVHVLCDDIYAEIAYAPFRFAALAAVAPDLGERILTVGGVSKAHAMTGWRIGWALGPAPLIRAMIVLQSQSTTNACSIAQHAALAALRGPQDHLDIWRARFLARRDAVVAALNAAPGIDCPVPEGAFYV